MSESDPFESVPPRLNTFKAITPLEGWAVVRRHVPHTTEAGLVLVGEAGKSFQPFLEVIESSKGYWQNGSFIAVNLEKGDYIQVRSSVCLEAHAMQPDPKSDPEWLFSCPLESVKCKVIPNETPGG